MTFTCEICNKQFNIKDLAHYQKTHSRTLCRECTSNETKKANIINNNTKKGIEPLSISMFSEEQIYCFSALIMYK